MKLDKPFKQLRFNDFNSGAAVSIILISNYLHLFCILFNNWYFQWAILILVHQHFHLIYSMLDMWANQHNEFKRIEENFCKNSIDASEIIWTQSVLWLWCSKKKKKCPKKRREKRGPLLFSLSSKKRSATPISLLLIKRSGTPPSLPILGVALGSGAQKSAAL